MVYDIQVCWRLAALISQIYFWNKAPHVSDSSSVHHQEFFTVHTAMVYVIQVCWQLAALISQIYFWNKTLHVSNSSSVHHQEFLTVHTAVVYVIQVCWLLASSKLSANLYLLLCVQWKTPDNGQRNCTKHVEFYSKNKFEKIVHLVGFIIRIKALRSAWLQLQTLVQCSVFWRECIELHILLSTGHELWRLIGLPFFCETN